MPDLSEISRKDFEKFLVEYGCIKKRQKGSHIVYIKAGLSRPIVVVAVRKLKLGVVRSCLRTLGVTPKEFLKWLSN